MCNFLTTVFIYIYPYVNMGVQMLTRKVQKVKDSFLVTIPKQLCTMYNIDQNTILEVQSQDGKIILTPVTATKDKTDNLK